MCEPQPADSQLLCFEASEPGTHPPALSQDAVALVVHRSALAAVGGLDSRFHGAAALQALATALEALVDAGHETSAVAWMLDESIIVQPSNIEQSVYDAQLLSRYREARGNTARMREITSERPLVWPKNGVIQVSDFETNALRNGLGGSWSAVSDQNDLGTVFNPDPVAWANGGYRGARALHMYGHFGRNLPPWPFAALIADFEPTDFSSVRSVRFFAKGDGKRYALALHRAAIHDHAFPLFTFQANGAWSPIEIQLKQIRQPNWGRQLPATWSDVIALALSPAPGLDNESFDLWVDALELVRS